MNNLISEKMRDYHEDVDETKFDDYVSNLNYSATQAESDSNIIECYLRELMNNATFLKLHTASTDEDEWDKKIQEDSSSFVTQSRRLLEKRRSSLTADCQQKANNASIRPKSSRYTSFSFDHLSSVVQDLFLAGTETMSNTLSWSMLYVAKYPELQSEVCEEIDRVLGREKLPTESHRFKMPYVEAFLNETMRFHCAGPILIPRSTTREITFRGYHIPADSFIMVNIWSCMRDPEFWTEPNEFNPRRFLDTSSPGGTKVVKNPAMMPFGVGKRACIGESIGRLQLFLIFTSILQKFSVTFANERDFTNKNLLDGIPGVGLNAPNVELKFKLR